MGFVEVESYPLFNVILPSEFGVSWVDLAWLKQTPEFWERINPLPPIFFGQIDSTPVGKYYYIY